jgi:hypothetical protein
VEKNKYYKNLVALFESTKEKEVLQEAIPMQQPVQQEPAVRQIPNQIDAPVQQQPIPAEDPMMDPGLSDADYLQGYDPMMMEPELSPIEDAIEVSEQKKLIKLLGLYRELMNYTTVFYDSLENVDTSTLEKEDNDEIRGLKKKILALKDKLRDYIIDRYADEKYEKSLYVYILLRTELLTIITLLRKVLGVDKNTKEDTKNNKST